MRRMIRSFAAASAAILLLSAFSAPATEASEGEREDSAAIKTLTDEMWKALGDHDLELFSSLCSDEWTLFTAAGNRFSVERLFEVHRENIRGFELEPSNVQVRVNGDHAWATYDAVMSGELQGEPWGGEFLMTHIYERRNGDWVCVHTHESRKPEEE